MSDFIVPQKTAYDQRRAADPSASAWVSANAGSGKTKVLADRVLRLLLEGVEPSRLLCLTFTKAAAANMSNRVFNELSAWVMMDDETLAKKLETLTGKKHQSKQLANARRLFASAVEAPGGLKIETIHAFCERLLHLFPFEANVPARFEVLDEMQSRDILEQAMRDVLIVASQKENPKLAAALTFIACETGDEGVNKVLREALRFKTFLREHAREAGGLERILRALSQSCGVSEDDTPETIRHKAIEDGIPPREWLPIADNLAAGSKTDQKQADKFRRACAATDLLERFETYCSIFLTQSGTPAARLATKAIDETIVEQLQREQTRIVELLDLLKAAESIARTRALFILADAVFERVEALKNLRGALDFDDLIARTVSLLQRADAAWILYKLDAGIDHVLIDEAQDTSPQQWTILKTLVTEFTAGEGVFPRPRTLFAVGDPKQSIYGFQGAAPHEFEASGRYFRRRSQEAQLSFEDVELTVSFRSAPEILSAVDAVFEVPEHRRGLSFEEKASAPVHESARPAAFGLVEIWEPMWKEPALDKDAWTLPLDEPEKSAPPVRLARKIAATLRHWMRHGDENGRVIPPGDVLILVRKRGAFFEAIIRALKDAGVPVAGADRLTVSEHMGVRDLVAAGRTTLLPQDDLTLAAALKSPLIGWTDEDLIRIAARRDNGVGLIEAIRQAVEKGDQNAQKALEILAEWHDLALRKGPFGFYASLLGPMGGRRILVSRLGAEAGDAIDAFLAQALDYERRFPPSLTGFLNAFEGTTGDIKRDLESAHNEVRVMTVHGAKGLEAPVVILVDGGEKPNGRYDPKLIEIEIKLNGQPSRFPVWAPRQENDFEATALARKILRNQAEEENNRLLYVALTRAKDRLIIASAINSLAPDAGNEAAVLEGTWMGMVIKGLEKTTPERGTLLQAKDHQGRWVLRWLSPGKSLSGFEEMSPQEEQPLHVPDWLRKPIEAEEEAMPPLQPSRALSAADHAHRMQETAHVMRARLRGQLTHTLLERLPNLPAAKRESVAEAFIKARAPRLPAKDRLKIVKAAIDVLNAPSLRGLFGEESRAEVALAGNVIVPDTSITLPISGRIDRLAVLDNEVHLADFKTGHLPIKGVQEAHVTQLALYCALMKQIMPDKKIRAFLIYTTGPEVVEITEEQREQAMRQPELIAPQVP